jgi:acyl-coenzyme A synthetase/AMP-(fatty) acid ligase
VYDARVFNQVVSQQGVTAIQVVPSLLRTLLHGHAFDRCGSLRRVFCGGEPLDVDLRERFVRECEAELVNLYGCTETAIDATFFRCDGATSGQVTPIGGPIANTRACILDDAMQPVPAGSPGELYVGGPGLARGYLHEPDQTAAAFLPDPFTPDRGARLYRTGDVARWSSQGDVQYLGRVDRQLKIRGARVEAAEVEAELKRHPDVADAVVGARKHQDGSVCLVAWLVPASGATPNLDELAGRLAARLPPPMVPSRYVRLAALPLTPSGKLDMARLPEPGEPPHTVTAPRTPLEANLLGLWEELLDTRGIGIGDNFFALGGHSLLAVRLAMRMGPLLGRDVACAEIFAKPTVAQWASGIPDKALSNS